MDPADPARSLKIQSIVIADFVKLFISLVISHLLLPDNSNLINSGTFPSLFDFSQSEVKEVEGFAASLQQSTMLVKLSEDLVDKFAPVFSRWWRLNWPYILKISLTDWKGCHQRVCRSRIPDLIDSAATRVPFQFSIPSCLFFAVKMKGELPGPDVDQQRKKKNHLHLIPLLSSSFDQLEQKLT